MFIGSFFLEKLVTTTSAVYLFENISMELHSSDFMRTKLFNWVRKIAKKKNKTERYWLSWIGICIFKQAILILKTENRLYHEEREIMWVGTLTSAILRLLVNAARRLTELYNKKLYSILFRPLMELRDSCSYVNTWLSVDIP